MPAYPASGIIEGSFRVVAERALPIRKSPNRQRLAARIVFWNLAVLFVAIGLPFLV